MPIKLLIVDDHPLFRQGLRDVLETDPECLVVGEAANGEEAIERAWETKPDVILMDINLPTSNGLQVTQRLTSDFPGLKVVVVTGYDDTEQVLYAFSAGAAAYCSKDIPPESLLRTIHAVHEGRFVVHDQVMDSEEIVNWLDETSRRYGRTYARRSESLFIPLSPREMEILELVTNGYSNKEIASRLGISYQTVKNHMTAILRKLRLDDRTQAAVYALKHGWVRLEGTRV